MTIFKRNGRYVVEVPTGGRTASGGVKRTRRVATSHAEAKKLEVKLKAERNRGMLLPSADLTVGSFLLTWASNLDQQGLKSRTIESYRQNVRDHLIPYIGNLKLINLHQTHVNDLVAQLKNKGLGANSQRIAVRTLSSALSVAERNDLVHRNVAKLADPIAVPRRRPLYIKPEQLGDFSDSIRGHRFEDLAYLYAHTGLRRGEGLGLKWSDLDLTTEPPTLTIRRSWTQKGNSYELTTPKTGESARMVPLTPELAERLSKRKRRALESQFLPPGQSIEDDFIFQSLEGLPYRGDTVTREIARMGSSAGIPHLGPHQFRHLHATMVLGEGLNMAMLSKHMGHSDIGTTINIYTHQTTEMVKKVGESTAKTFSLNQTKMRR
jgi:integrase